MNKANPHQHLSSTNISQCINPTDTITKIFPVNLPLLHNCFKDDELQDILSTTIFDKPLSILVPQLEIYKHKMSHIVATDRECDLSLKKTIEKTKNNTKLYDSIADAYLMVNFPLLTTT